MSTIRDKIIALESFQSRKDAIIMDLVKDVESIIIEMQKDQLWEGERSDNSDINPQYTRFTVEIKNSVGQPTDRVTLQDTGDFYRSITLVFHRSHFEIIALDHKTGSLIEKYQKEILGLQEENIQVLRNLIKVGLQETFNAIAA